MADQEKFEGFKQKMIDDNEEKYGKEIREKYGEEAVDSSNQKLMGMTTKQYEAFEKLGASIEKTLKDALKTGDPKGELGQKAADLHKQWLSFTWGSYTKEAHASLARMYVDDERFKAYYDKIALGAAEFLRDAILIYTGIGE